jgi:hypothetical protein
MSRVGLGLTRHVDPVLRAIGSGAGPCDDYKYLSDGALSRRLVGEGGASGAPGAVLKAVTDALSPFGVDIFEMPVTPQRIVVEFLREYRSQPQ